MECPPNETLARFSEKTLNTVESALIRDHLIHCMDCRRRVNEFAAVDRSLSQPRMLTPPPVIEKSVMRRLFPVLPTYGAVFAFVIASLLLLVTWIYIYFDFANNSLIQAMQVTSNRLFRLMGGLIQGISTVFSGVYAGFKAISKLLSALIHVNLQGEVVLLGFIFLAVGAILAASRLFPRKRHDQSQSRAI